MNMADVDMSLNPNPSSPPPPGNSDPFAILAISVIPAKAGIQIIIDFGTNGRYQSPFFKSRKP